MRYGAELSEQRHAAAEPGLRPASLGFPQSLMNEIRTKNDPAGIAFPEIVVEGGAYTNLGANGGTSFATAYHTFGGDREPHGGRSQHAHRGGVSV